MRITFKYLQQVAESRGFIFEESGYRQWELCHNTLGNGVTAVYETLTEAWADIHGITEGRNPLTGQPLPIVLPVAGRPAEGHTNVIPFPSMLGTAVRHLSIIA